MADAVSAEVSLPHPLRRAPHAVQPSLRAITAVVGLAALAACSKSENAAATERSSERDGPHAAPIVEPAGSPYRAVAISQPGRVRGVVKLDGDAPSDTTVRPTNDEAVCGASLVDRTMQRSGDRLGGVLVWLVDLRSGKSLPRARRFELTNERCQITPRVQATVVGGTLNVRNADQTQHRTRFVRQGSGELLALVGQTDAGQVVPVEKVLAAPGMVEARNDQHPWMRGWVAVFDHPYYGVTGRDGAFTFDSVPPGTYRVMAWHERLGRVDQKVTVAAGREATVEIKLAAP